MFNAVPMKNIFIVVRARISFFKQKKPKVEIISKMYGDVACDILNEGLIYSDINNIDKYYLLCSSNLKDRDTRQEVVEKIEKFTLSRFLVYSAHENDDITQLKMNSHTN